ncbi:Transmembrane protein, TqsA-like [Desulfonema limicola]|uniref:Transmembrane protein, TqsA-like n=1 Tax=Desulfonema limicola TaxID=45656 RepID=A0A975GEL4_9BACT|nr:AI-2E family transporter [Desulfonema limicola]QTA78255.1 Transmembrane protein, TqsA-like [Desulfonema limicola]
MNTPLDKVLLKQKEPFFNNSSNISIALKSLIILACIVIIVAGMRAADSLLVPFLLAVFIGIICSPPLFWLKSKGISSAIALIIVIAGIVGVTLAASLVIGGSLKDFLQNLPVYQNILQQKLAAMTIWLNSMGISTTEFQSSELFDSKSVMNIIGKMLGGLSKIFTNTFVILLTVIFILLEASGFPLKLRAALSSPDESLSRLSQVTDSVRQYLAIKTMCSLLTGVLIALLLYIIGIKQSVLWGFIAFLFNFIPNIGSIIAAVPAIIMALIQFDTAAAVYTLAGYIFINLSISNIIEPKFMGRGLGLSTLVVFISLVFWGWVLGPVGMLLSVLLTTILKIALESSEETMWLAILLGPARAVKPDIQSAVKG